MTIQRADEGDHGRIAEIDLRLGEIGGELRDLRQGKAAFESYRQQALRAPEPQQPEPPGERTTVGVSREAFMNGDRSRGVQGRTEATKAWLREHDEFFTDPKVMKKVTAADMLADAEGIRRDTPEYFKFVEEQAGMRTPTRQSSSRNGGDVYVSPEDRRAAEWMFKGMPGGYTAKYAENYAIERAELKRKGQFPMRRR